MFCRGTYSHQTLLGMVSVFQENRVRIHVKFMFAQKTCKLFPTQTKGKHIIIIPSVCIWKRKPVWFFVFCENRQKILCIQGKQSENMLSPSAWWQHVFWLFPLNTENFLSVFTEYKESNRLSFSDANRWNNYNVFSLCLRGKQFTCFLGKHKLYMYSNPVFLEYRDHPQQCLMRICSSTKHGSNHGLPLIKCSSYFYRSTCSSNQTRQTLLNFLPVRMPKMLMSGSSRKPLRPRWRLIWWISAYAYVPKNH